jgi:hypothetical protein
MAQTIGVLVRSDEYFQHLLNFCRAAYEKGCRVLVFFSGRGVLLTQEREFPALLDTATPYVCEVSYRANGLQGVEVPGVGFKQFVTQARNAEMIAESDRYLVF